MTTDRHPFARIAALAATLALCACVDTKTGSNGTGSPQSILVAGTLQSTDPLSVGGTSLDAATASIRIDESPNAAGAGLRLGMSFEALGLVADANATPALQSAGTQSSAIGQVRAIDATARTLTVATLTFVVDQNTVFDGVPDLSALNDLFFLEVHGLPTADPRVLLATRVTRIFPGVPLVAVVGRIEGVSGQNLQIAGFSVPAQALGTLPIVVGARARVTGFQAGATTLTNPQVSILTDYAATANARVDLEGIALQGAAAGGAFRLRTPARDYDIAASAGTSAVLPGARVHVTGVATAVNAVTPDLVAPVGSITYRVSGTVSDFRSLASLRVRGESVDLSIAVIRGGSAGDIANGKRIAIVAIAAPGGLRATEATILP